MFTDRVINSKYVVDSWNVELSEHCYECIACKNCSSSFFTEYSENCQDIRHCFDCKNCSYCIGCVSLVNKKYCILNQEVSKEKFESTLEAMKNDSVYQENLKQKFIALRQKTPHSSRMSHTSNTSYCIESSHTQDAKFVVE